MKRLRLIVFVVFVVFSLGGVLLFQALNVRDTPLQLGDGQGTITDNAEMTAEAPTHTQASTSALVAPYRDVAFIGNRDGTWDIYLLTADGTLSNLTQEGDAHDYFPSWSLDGGQINFLSNRGRATELGPSQVNADGTGLRSLDIVTAILTLFSEQRFDWDPAWSPNGERLLWSSLRDLNLELYAIGLDAEFSMGNATRLTADGGRDWFGAWSPDGERIAFSTDRQGNEDIAITSVQGGDVSLLTDNPWDEIHAMFAWDEGDERLVYVSDEEDSLLRGDLNLWQMQPDGSQAQPLADAFTGDALWSPDGAYFLLVSNAPSDDNTEGRWQIFLHRASDGERLGRITPPDADWLFPVWRP